MGEKKKCTVCHENKPIEAFSIQRSARDGRQFRCKACFSAWKRAYTKSGKSAEAARKLRATERGRKMANARNTKYFNTDKGKAQQRSRNRAYAKRYPEKIKARIMVREAIERGLLVQQPCNVCGSSPVEAHHPDYSRPLEVQWLCVIHHNEVHHGRV